MNLRLSAHAIVAIAAGAADAIAKGDGFRDIASIDDQAHRSQIHAVIGPRPADAADAANRNASESRCRLTNSRNQRGAASQLHAVVIAGRNIIVRSST